MALTGPKIYAAPARPSRAVIQRGRVLKARDLGQYDVILDDGTPVTAGLMTFATGAVTLYKNGTQVVCCLVPDGACYIMGVPGQIFQDPADQKEGEAPVRSSDRPRIEDLVVDEICIAYPDKSSGLHCHASGAVELSTATPNDDPNKIVNSKITLIPIHDAIHMVSLRHENEPAAGDIHCYLDTLTGDTAMRMFARASVKAGMNEKRLRFQMGKHEDFKQTVMSLFVYPKGILPPMKPDIGASLMPEKYDGIMQLPDRKDWATRIMIEDDGTFKLDTAFVPVATPAPTTIKTCHIQIDPMGEFTLENMQDINIRTEQSLNVFVAEDADVEVDGDVTVEIEGDTTVEIDGDTLITCPNVEIDSSDTVVIECEDITLGVSDDAIPVANKNTYDWLVDQLYKFAISHTHPDAQGGTTGSSSTPLEAPPDDTLGITQNVTLS